MPQKILLLLLFLVFSCAQAVAQPLQNITPISAQAAQYFNFSERTITANGQEYKIFIAAPKAAAPRRGNPVLYILDGNAQFPMAVNSYRPENGQPPLIVGIGYVGDLAYFVPERTRDYTVPATGEEFAKGGGAEDFYLFIQNSVKPAIHSAYKVDKRRQTLMGHSFGGVFTLYVLFNHTGSFQRYVAASPALWWGNGAVVPKKSKLLDANPESLTITVGEYEEKDEPAQPQNAERKARSALRGKAIKARDLAFRLQNEGTPCVFISYQGKTHGGSVTSSVAQGVFVAGD